MRKIGIIMHAVKGMSDEEYLREISSAGFSATFTTPREDKEMYDLAELCEKYNVSIESLHADCTGGLDIWRDGDEGDMVTERFKACVDACALVGVPIAVVHLDGHGFGGITEIGHDRYKRVVDYAYSKNVKIAFENQNDPVPVGWALDTFGENYAGYCYDCGHARFTLGGDDFIKRFGERIICVHLHDNLGPVVDGNNDFHMVPLDGNINFERIVDELKEVKFNGTVMLELKYRGTLGNVHYYDHMNASDYIKHAFGAANRLRDMLQD